MKYTPIGQKLFIQSIIEEEESQLVPREETYYAKSIKYQ